MNLHLCFLVLPLAWAWEFTDSFGNKFTGSSSKPKIVCHPDVCDSLWGMGVPMEQLVGYFSTVSTVRPCHGHLCHDFHWELMTHVKGEGNYDVQIDKIKQLAPDIIVDVSYKWKDTEGYSGLLKYSPQLKDLQALGIPMAQISVGGSGYLEVLDTFQKLAIAMGDQPNADTMHHCDAMHAAMKKMTTVAKKMAADGIRVGTGSFTKTMLYAAQPTDDPILIMLEELGVPMVHVNVTDPRGGYWEFINFPEHDRNTANMVLPSGGKMYPVDVWLYDARSTRYHEEDINITDPAWDAKQYTIWPIDAPYTYEQGTRILNTVSDVFAKAKRVTPKTDCTQVDVSKRARMAPGSWACHDPKSDMPSCPKTDSPSTSTSPVSWSHKNIYGEYSGTTKSGKPRIVCHPDVCESLWSMGLREDQLVGYFSSVSDLCHGGLCHQFHFEVMTSVKGEGNYDVDVAKLKELAPDMIIDESYNWKDAGTGYNGLLKYSPQLKELQASGIPMIQIQVGGIGFLEVVDELQKIAIAVGAPPNIDTHRHCDMLHVAMKEMTTVGKKMAADGIRVLAGSFTKSMIYLAQPTDDPILLMLEELGVPMLHVNVTDPRGGYWEFVTFPEHNRKTSDIVLPSGGKMYAHDVWLYDARSTRYHEEDINITDPAWEAGQYTIWPIDGSFTYEQGTRILNTLRNKFVEAKRVGAPTTCTAVDVSKRARMAPGSWACHDPKADLPKCPVDAPPAPAPPAPASPAPAPPAGDVSGTTVAPVTNVGTTTVEVSGSFSMQPLIFLVVAILLHHL